MNNPFSPGKILIDSTRYAGREILITEAYEYLTNERSIFITGKRGVGKSSFAMQIVNLMNKNPTTFDRFNISLDTKSVSAITVNYRCTGHENFQEIIINLLYALSRKLDKPLIKIEKISKKWGVDFKVLSHENLSEESILTPSITREFSEIIIECFEKFPRFKDSGVCFIIDEIDMLIGKVELGIFIKVFLENLSDVGIQNVTFVLVGIDKGLNVLKSQHPSITRYVVPIYIPPMNQNELNDIIQRALDQTGVIFSKDICDAVYMLSKGFPDLVHLFGYEIFSLARKNDQEVDHKIFETVLRKIATKIKKEDFLNTKNKIPDIESERLLLEMAKIDSELGYLSLLAKKLEISEEECYKICKILSEQDILEQQGIGIYGFADPLFRVYLNLVNVEKEIHAIQAEIFTKLNKMVNEISVSQSEEDSKKREQLMFEIIKRNFEETGRTGFWG